MLVSRVKIITHLSRIHNSVACKHPRDGNACLGFRRLSGQTKIGEFVDNNKLRALVVIPIADGKVRSVDGAFSETNKIDQLPWIGHSLIEPNKFKG